MSDGSFMYISAKRACGNDSHFEDTVQQWIRQAATLNNGDRLALAVAEPRGKIKKLGEALVRRRANSKVYPAPERDAIKMLEERLASEPNDVRAKVLDAACVLIIDAAEVGRNSFDLAAALLEGTIVSSNEGIKAVRVLSEAMHTEAGKAFSSGVSDWLSVLEEADINVYADRAGPPGAAAQAAKASLSEYKARLSSHDGVVDLTLLAEDLPALVVTDLADNLRVSVPDSQKRRSEESFLTLARRWPRMLLVGLPGAGKSTALRQLAARWARNDDAPVPILVPLGRASRHCNASEDLTLSFICKIAAQGAPNSEQLTLAAELERTCKEGRAVLLLDGLDECLQKKALIAEGIRSLLSILPSDNGVILATRTSAISSARRLEMPSANLVTPLGLDKVLHRLLVHAADLRLPEHHRKTWVKVRANWLREASEAHEDLVAVPLLATLLTLVVADSADEVLPNRRAQLLMKAVQNSVRRWEAGRPGRQPQVGAEPTDEQLLQGYAALGGLLSTAGELTISQGLDCIRSLLREQWGLAPGPAGELSHRILWFWDEHVGVFISTNKETIVSRSRVFTDIASAMWTVGLEKTRLASWIQECTRNDDYRASLLLAAELEPTVIDLLLDEEHPDFYARILLASEAAQLGAPLRPSQQNALIQHLTKIAHQKIAEGEYDTTLGSDLESLTSDEKQRAFDGSGWEYIYHLAHLKLSSDLHASRRRYLEGFELTRDQRITATALAVLSDSIAEKRELADDEITTVQELLNLPLPSERNRVARKESGIFVILSDPEILTGRTEAAAAAAHYLDQLSDGADDLIRKVANFMKLPLYYQTSRIFASNGLRLDEKDWHERISGIGNLVEQIRAVKGLPLFQSAGALSDEQVALSHAARWRLPDLCNLFAALKAETIGMRDLASSTSSTSEVQRETWLRTATLASGLDRAMVAAQGRQAVVTHNDEDALLKLILCSPPSDKIFKLDGNLLDRDTQQIVAKNLDAVSDWIFNSYVEMLWESPHRSLREKVIQKLPKLSPTRRRLAAILACTIGGQPVETALRLFELSDPIVQCGAARIMSHIAEQDETAQMHLGRMQLSNDLSVRFAARNKQSSAVDQDPPATVWSCSRCGSFNNVDAVACDHCEQGARPRDEGESV